jgi:hypothetical protein
MQGGNLGRQVEVFDLDGYACRCHGGIVSSPHGPLPARPARDGTVNIGSAIRINRQ